MDKHEQIRQRLRGISALNGPQPTLLGIVEDVDAANATCTLRDESTGLFYYDVRLHPVLKRGESLTLYPAKDSWAIAARLENTEEWMVLACCTIDKWALKINDTTIEQDATGLLIQKQNDTLRQALELIIQAVMETIVVEGRNPNYSKLQQALTKIQNILR